MSKTENQIQRQIKQYLDIVLSADSFWTAINPIPSKTIIAASNSKKMGMKAGVPDLLILHKGKTIWIEVKKEGGYLSRRQKEVHEQIAMAGGDVFTARSVEDVQKLLQKWGVI